MTDDRLRTNYARRRSSVVGRPVFDELAALWAIGREWQLWMLLMLGVVAWSLAYQIPYRYEVNFGGDKLAERRRDDEPFIRGWNQDPEPTDDVWLTERGDQAPYRWAFDQAELCLPGLGNGRWHVAILAAGQPTPLPTRSVWSDGTITSTLLLTQEPRFYQHVFSSDAQGNLDLRFATQPLSTETDPRPLGFVGFTAVVRSFGPQAPPTEQLAMLALALGAMYALARRLVLPRHAAVLLGGGCVLLVAALLGLQRVALTSFTPTLGLLLLGCYPLAVLVARLPVLRWDERARGLLLTRVSPSPIAALVVLGFAIRLGGMLHPQILFSDIGLNANNLREFIEGVVYQQEGLPSEAGGGQSPYPVGQYIVAAPLRLLFAPAIGDRELIQQNGDLLKFVNALMDSMVIGLLWYVLRRRAYGQAAALFAAALYLVPGPALKSFGVGEFANLAGQSLALPLAGALALAGGQLRQVRVAAIMVALMLFAMLGHSGVTISMVLLLGYLGVNWMLGSRTFRRVIPLFVVGMITAVLLALFYHSAYLHLFIGPHEGAEVAAALPERSFSTKLANEMNRVFGGPTKPVSPLLVVTGALGLVAMALRPRPRDAAPGLWPVVIAWWGSAALSLGMLAIRDQTVRWDLFLYPALCISTGVLLTAFWRRGWAGKTAAALILGALLMHGMLFWLLQIHNYLHT